MENKKENAVERLLKSYRRFYNITHLTAIGGRPESQRSGKALSFPGR